LGVLVELLQIRVLLDRLVERLVSEMLSELSAECALTDTD